MSEITGISYIDSNNTYNANPSSKSDNNDFSSFLGQEKSLEEIFSEAAQQYNLPVELLKAVGKTESDFNPNAVSRCGAQGVMQLMPATAKGLGVTDSFDAEQNIMGGAKYLSALMKKYDGDTRLALAAYNAGSGNVAKYGGIPPFDETQNYVKKVMNYMGQDISIASDDKGQYVTARTASAAPVQKNLAFLLTNETSAADDGLDNLNSLFSYDDYVKFLEIFMNSEKEEQEEQKKTDYSSNQIDYNVPVMNLLKNQKLI